MAGKFHRLKVLTGEELQPQDSKCFELTNLSSIEISSCRGHEEHFCLKKSGTVLACLNIG
jgi:hypothetical protein